MSDYILSNQSIVIGPGYVGKATAYALEINDIIGKEEHIYGNDYRYFFLCVPTPTDKDGKQDLSAIEEWLIKIKKLNQDKDDKIVIIRSTILPGTTDKYSQKYNLHIAHIPEFLSENTAIEDELNPEFIVIGCGDIVIREKLKKLFIPLGHPINFILCDPTTAELIKYSMNSFFTLKVIYSNQLWDVAKEVGANYEKVKEALESHKWGSKNGWDVWHKKGRGAGGKCLKKDLRAFVNKFNVSLLKEVNNINEKLINETSKQ